MEGERFFRNPQTPYLYRQLFLTIKSFQAANFNKLMSGDVKYTYIKITMFFSNFCASFSCGSGFLPLELEYVNPNRHGEYL